MNRIEDKSRYELDTNLIDHRYNAVLYLTNRQVSWLTASIVLLSFFIFIAGYFLGQKKALEQFNKVVDRIGVVDSLYSNIDTDNVLSGDNMLPSIEQPEIVEKKPKQYYAQLIGFGTLRAADRFADRLQQRNIPVKVVEKHSKTAQGKKIIWYQVVTETFNKKDDLLAFTQRIEKEERLNDIRIVSC